MPQVNFNYWALHCLNRWLSKDRRFCEALQGDDEPAKLQDLTEAATFYSIMDVTSQISKRFGGRGVMSLSTEFLWLKMKSPIVIYDRQARKALGTNSGDIGAYYSRWREQFNLSRNEIDAACATLPRVHEYSVAPDLATLQYIEGIASQPWFKERVFDVYL